MTTLHTILVYGTLLLLLTGVYTFMAGMYKEAGVVAVVMVIVMLLIKVVEKLM